MTASEKPQLSVAGYAALALGILRTLIVFVFALITGPFRGESAPRSYWHHVIFTTLRAFTRYVTPVQIQAVLPTTVETYAAFVKEKNLPYVESVLADGTRGLWFGSKSADRVIFFFHGGGYVTACSPAHFQFIYDVMHRANTEGGSVAVFTLAYDMSPWVRYPRHIVQAAHSLNYLTEEMGISPSRITFAGDSAGAHLALGLLSHMSTPHPDVPAVKATTPVAGSMLISPWVTFALDAPSMKTNRRKDLLDLACQQSRAEDFVGDAAVDSYNSPLLAEPEWWKDIKTKKICVVVGSDEIFLDDNLAFVEKLRVYQKGVELFVAEGENHDSAFSDITFGFPERAYARKIRAWLLENTR